METSTEAKLHMTTEMPNNPTVATSTLEEDAQYLRVTLDKSENMRIAALQKIREILIDKFDNDIGQLKRWYENKVWEGKAHRAWSSIEKDLAVVRNPEKYPDPAKEFGRRRNQKRQRNSRAAARNKENQRYRGGSTTPRCGIGEPFSPSSSNTVDQEIEATAKWFHTLSRENQEKLMSLMGVRRILDEVAA